MILVVTNYSFDLGDPVYMTVEKRNIFIKKLRELYGDVEEVKVTEPLAPPLSRKTGERWSADQLAVLFEENLSIKQMATKLGKDPMSITMQLGDTVPKILIWMKEKKGINIIPTKEDIQQYMMESRNK
jgi:hypothetical protein